MATERQLREMALAARGMESPSLLELMARAWADRYFAESSKHASGATNSADDDASERVANS